MKTKIFCDSADIKTIKEFNNNSLVNGFTTNPSLMRKAGAKINHAFVIFHYRIFKEGGGKLKKEKIKLHSLSNWHDAISVAKKKNYFDEQK